MDPRTTLLQSLEAILLAGLADNAYWEALIALTQQARAEALVEPFARALTAEQEHLQKVQAWLAAGQGRTSPETREEARSHQLLSPLVYEAFPSL